MPLPIMRLDINKKKFFNIFKKEQDYQKDCQLLFPQ